MIFLRKRYVKVQEISVGLKSNKLLNSITSAYNINGQVHNKRTISFTREKNKETDYMVSNCAGAQLVGASGIAEGKKIVTWIGGGTQLQND